MRKQRGVYRYGLPLAIYRQTRIAFRMIREIIREEK